jgi:hypothetical protein
MKCEDVGLLLQDHLDGELLASQRESVDAHLARCPLCRHLLDSLCALDFALGGVGETGVAPDLTGRVLASLPKDTLGKRVMRAAFRSHPLVAAASFVLLLSLGVVSAYRAGETTSGLREVEVTLAYPGASSVSLMGDFNAWDRKGMPMTRASGGGWRVTLKVPRGVYHYNLLVDGETIVHDPGAAAQVDDGFGGTSSVMVVEG